MVELQLPKLTTRVRFPSPAPLSTPVRAFLLCGDGKRTLVVRRVRRDARSAAGRPQGGGAAPRDTKCLRIPFARSTINAREGVFVLRRRETNPRRVKGSTRRAQRGRTLPTMPAFAGEPHSIGACGKIALKVDLLANVPARRIHTRVCRKGDRPPTTSRGPSRRGREPSISCRPVARLPCLAADDR